MKEMKGVAPVAIVVVIIVAIVVAAAAYVYLRPSEEDGEKEVEEVLFWHTYSPHEENKAKELLREFEEDHPNIKIKMEYLPYDALYTKLLTYLAVEQAPADLIRLDVIFVPQLADLGVLLELDNYMEELGIEPEDFFPGPWETCVWKNHIYGLPLNTCCQCLMYRKDYFETENLNPPRDWDEYLDVAKKLTKDTDGDGEIDQWGAIFSDWSWHFNIFLWGAGGSELNPDKTKCVINEEPGVEALTFLVDMILEHKVTPPWQHWGMPFREFALGNYSMMIEGPWAKKLAETVDPDTDRYLGVAPLPSGQVKQTSIVGGEDLVIPKYTEHREAALEVARYLVSKDFQLGMFEADVLPTTKEAASDPITSQDPFMMVFVEQMENALPRAVHPIYGSMNQIIHNYLVEAFRGNLTPEGALDAMAMEIDEKLKEFEED